MPTKQSVITPFDARIIQEVLENWQDDLPLGKNGCPWCGVDLRKRGHGGACSWEYLWILTRDVLNDDS